MPPLLTFASILSINGNDCSRLSSPSETEDRNYFSKREEREIDGIKVWINGQRVLVINIYHTENPEKIVHGKRKQRKFHSLHTTINSVKTLKH